MLNNTNQFPNNNESHFVSANLARGRHRLVIDSINASSGRNYTISSFVISGNEATQLESSGNRSALIVGVVIGVLALLLVIGFVGWKYRRVQKSSQPKPEDSPTRLSAGYIKGE